MTPEKYKSERMKRGTQESVALRLGVHRVTIAKRECGSGDAPITREAWLALLSLPKTKARKNRTAAGEFGQRF